MKKLILACALATSAASAFAEWTKVGEVDEGSTYIEYKTIRKDGNLRMIWQIQDLKQRHKDGEMSRRARYQYDCKNDRSRFLSMTAHSESMGKGLLLAGPIKGSGQWYEIAPNTTTEEVLKIVCAE
jgi:hypothetical protein